MWRVRLQLSRGRYSVEVKSGFFGEWRDPYFAFGCDSRVNFYSTENRPEADEQFDKVVNIARKRNYQIEEEKILSRIKPITIRKWP